MQYQLLDEHYDLVVVGGRMSGLASAWYFRRKMGAAARILILDNHDDFGGHAKRNEFHHNGRMVLSLGGAQNLDSPGNYSEAAGNLMRDLGIDQNAIDAMDENTPTTISSAASGMATSGCPCLALTVISP